ncbi:MAG TPA: VCBS repeat-containing protein [Chitinophagaceae bacterium]|nr:VCBS repeat-containing protein [Chitinophagaceae bacterium]
MKHFSAPFTILFFILLYIPVVFISCTHAGEKKQKGDHTASAVDKGKALATQYCQSCHLLPDPSLLDKNTWEHGALPAMGPHLGIFQYGFESYPSRRADRDVDSNYYPPKPVISLQQWQNIIDYYVGAAPDSLPPQHREYPIHTGLPLFMPEFPALSDNPPATGLIKIDSSTHTFYIGDVIQDKLYRFNERLKATDSVKTRGPLVGLDFEKNNMLACNIGILNPNDGKHGSGNYIDFNAKGKMVAEKQSVFDSLKRPVQITEADLNNDGKTDYIICEFGNTAGALSWMENRGNGKFERHVLRGEPGAISVYTDDYNHDGLPDIWALMAQADESIVLFTNKGNGQFDQRQVLRFPSVYGSSSFELDDFNNDGYPDILYTCGDNADFSQILKPYHGVYIFLNDGKNHFTQKYFFPIHGCYKAIAKDFDGDGDLDIATISFFADYKNQPEEGFVYLENEGNFDFRPYTLPAGKLGRWLTMDAGDIDGDGRPDIILGNFSFAMATLSNHINFKKEPAFIVLKNTGKK